MRSINSFTTFQAIGSFGFASRALDITLFVDNYFIPILHNHFVIIPFLYFNTFRGFKHIINALCAFSQGIAYFTSKNLTFFTLLSTGIFIVSFSTLTSIFRVINSSNLILFTNKANFWIGRTASEAFLVTLNTTTIFFYIPHITYLTRSI